MVALRLEREVCSVLVWRIVPQSELDDTAVDARAQAVSTGEPVEPGDTAEELSIDSSWTLRVAIGFIKEDWAPRATLVGHLVWRKREREYDQRYGI